MTPSDVKHPPLLLMLSVLVLAEFTAGFEVTMVFGALKTLTQVFGDPIGVGWLVTIYLLVSAGAAAIFGRLGDLYGRKGPVLIALGFAAAGSFISAVAPSLEWLIAGRAMQGIAGAIMPLCFGLVREHLRADKIPLGVGVVTASASVGAGCGLIIGGYLLDNYSWQSMFVVSGGMALVSLLGVWMFLPRSSGNKPSGRLDLVGGLLFAPAIGGVLLAVSSGPGWGWLDARTLVAGVGGALLLIFWVFYELRHPNPLIDVRLLANRNIAIANIVVALIAMGSMNVIQVMSLFMQQPLWTVVGLGFTATVAGLMKLPSSVCGVIAATWSGIICGTRGTRFALLLGIGMFTASWLLLIPFHGSIWVLLPLMIAISSGIAMSFTAVPSIIVTTAPEDRTSEATGLMMSIRAIAQGVGAQMIAFLLATETISNPQSPGVFPTEGAYLLTFGVMAATGILAALATLALPKVQPQAGAVAQAH